MRRLGPPHVIVISFLCAITAGTILLGLPWAAPSGDTVSLIDRLFTATSATCVTGLVVREPASWAPFGQAVIMVLFQAGGLGIMTFSTLFAILLGRKLTIKEDLVVKGTIGHSGVVNMRVLLFHIVAIVFLLEAVGAGLLFWRWRVTEAWPASTTAYNAVFHSISAFCNAGFSLFRDSFTAYSGDPYINLIMMALIFLGGIGFVVIVDVWNLRTRAVDKRPAIYRLSVQTKVVLSVSLILILVGALVIFFLEGDNVFAGQGTQERVLGSFFQAITARTAGFNTLPTGSLATPTLVFILFLMFIGASPGSTGGGIKTCTFAVVLASVWAMIRNKNGVWIFRKTIPKTIVKKALVIFILALGWIFLASLLLSITERDYVSGADYYLKILFETTSAFGTVGLSTGITSALSGLGKLLLVITMFVGRIGPLTLALALAIKEEKPLYDFPVEQVMVG